MSIEKLPGRQTFSIEAGSILHIPERLDGVTKARYENLVMNNKFIVLMEDISTDTDKFYKFNSSLKLKDAASDDFFKKSSAHYFINAKGERIRG